MTFGKRCAVGALLAALLGSSSGCVQYLPADRMVNATAEVLLFYDRYLVLSGPFFEENARGLQTASRRQAFQEMKRCMGQLEQLRGEAKQLRQDFLGLYGKRDRITSDDPEWPAVLRLRAAYESLKGRTEAATTGLEQAALAFLGNP